MKNLKPIQKITTLTSLLLVLGLTAGCPERTVPEEPAGNNTATPQATTTSPQSTELGGEGGGRFSQAANAARENVGNIASQTREQLLVAYEQNRDEFEDRISALKEEADEANVEGNNRFEQEMDHLEEAWDNFENLVDDGVDASEDALSSAWTQLTQAYEEARRALTEAR